jgi:undecaprenyl-diphosphatase
VQVAVGPDVRIVRRPADAVRVAIGSLALAACSVFVAHTSVGRLEKSVFHHINELPSWLYRILWLPMQCGALAAVFVFAAVAAVFRRFRLASQLLGAGLLAYYSAIALKNVVGRGRPLAVLSHTIVHGPVVTGLGFPSGHAAVSTALAATAAPFLLRPWRWWVWLVPITVCVARVYVGAHLPLDVVGGFVLGWTVGALVHLVAGAPRTALPPARQVRQDRSRDE